MAGCRSNNASKTTEQPRDEDTVAKKMLQGIWIDEDEEDVFFKVKGDTIYYPDSTSAPAYFRILHDTLYIEGSNVSKYPIVKQAAHVFQFKNQGGDVIQLIKSNNPEDADLFKQNSLTSLYQNQLVKRDSVVQYGADRYHWYVQINPTSYKVYCSYYNEDGVEVDNIYYDNIIHISLFKGATQIYSKDFYKKDFAKNVPQIFLKQSILSDIEYTKTDSDGFHFASSIQKPGSSSSYVIDVIISFNGKMTMKVE